MLELEIIAFVFLFFCEKNVTHNQKHLYTLEEDALNLLKYLLDETVCAFPDFEILHTCIDPAWSRLECNQSFCTDVCALWWARRLTYILHSAELHLVKKNKKKNLLLLFFFPLLNGAITTWSPFTYWLPRAMVISWVWLCISNAPVLQRRPASVKYCQPSLHPPPKNIRQHSQEVKSTHQRKGEAGREGFYWDFSFLYHYDYMSTPCPLPSLLL